ncbi:hypothetical protein BKK50_09005 [Rodentibacter rarus]|uniref:Uncharacterized protein n=1 Tax=Rodentibacter rarus TaxID=1908260 RepID=A0A1V3IIT2_9PAST|nr:hypothetical protein BKK50_09005 [Rodentibacter rarus]
MLDIYTSIGVTTIIIGLFIFIFIPTKKWILDELGLKNYKLLISSSISLIIIGMFVIIISLVHDLISILGKVF